MRVFKENENNDIESTGITYLSDILAVEQLAKSAMEVQLGEMIFRADRGIPNNEISWNNTNLQQFNYYAIKTLKSVDGVISVSDFKSAVVGDKIVYSVTIKTRYGTTQIGTFNGSI